MALCFTYTPAASQRLHVSICGDDLPKNGGHIKSAQMTRLKCLNHIRHYTHGYYTHRLLFSKKELDLVGDFR